MGRHVVWKLLLLVVCCSRAWGEPAPARAGAREPDEMLALLEANGATRAAVCVGGGAGAGAGCGAALWARHWLLARASCLEAARQPVHRALVLLHREPEDCQLFYNKPRPAGALEALVRVVHPGYALAAPPEDEGWGGAVRRAGGPLDAALVLLAAPAPPPRAGNHSATIALLPELSWWLRAVPAGVPWALERPPAREAVRADPARLRWLDSPLRVLAATALLPPALMLAVFALFMNWPCPLRSASASTANKDTLIDCDMLLGDEV